MCVSSCCLLRKAKQLRFNVCLAVAYTARYWKIRPVERKVIVGVGIAQPEARRSCCVTLLYRTLKNSGI